MRERGGTHQLHAVAAVLPMLQYVPASQLAQPDSADSPAAPLYVPAGHSVTADAPCRQYPPALQSTQSDAPVDAWNVPAAHLLHVA